MCSQWCVTIPEIEHTIPVEYRCDSRQAKCGCPRANPLKQDLRLVLDGTFRARLMWRASGAAGRVPLRSQSIRPEMRMAKEISDDASQGRRSVTNTNGDGLATRQLPGTPTFSIVAIW